MGREQRTGAKKRLIKQVKNYTVDSKYSKWSLTHYKEDYACIMRKIVVYSMFTAAEVHLLKISHT